MGDLKYDEKVSYSEDLFVVRVGNKFFLYVHGEKSFPVEVSILEWDLAKNDPANLKDMEEVI